jgi:4-hydroxybenzoate polyprenyltransferase
VRAGEWWEYKLVPIVSAFYATAVVLGVPLVELWPAAVMMLLSLLPGAAYVSVVNDLTDRADDAAAGKRNRTIGKPAFVIAAWLLLTIGMGVVFAWIWRRDLPLVGCYLAAWLAFSLYSIPPFRFKTRGLLGVFCDACGAHLFPTAVAAILPFRAAGRPLQAPWLAAVCVWAFAYGVRGILWHQLTDRENDRSAGVRTFAQRHAPETVARLGTFVAFPLELLALAAMLWQLRSAWPLAFFAPYLWLCWRRRAEWRMNAVIVAPKPHFFIVLHEYYDVFFPLALLLAAAFADPRDFLVLAAHLLLFPARLGQTIIDVRKLRPRHRPAV